MRKPTLLAVAIIIFIGCSTKIPDLTSQLKTNFSSHLIKVDSAVVIDSFSVIAVDTLVEKLGKIIDDTIYIRELHAVQAQLAHALMRPRKDSIEYFQNEVNYMSGQIDTLTMSIKTADTKNKFGILARCYFQISKKDKAKSDFVFYFIDSRSNILSTDIIDSSINRAYKYIK
jgi:hypothetical protein